MTKMKNLAVVVVSSLTLFAGCKFVPYDSYGIVVRWEKVDDEALSPGLYPINPLTTDIQMVSSQVQTLSLENLDSSTSDGQSVQATVVLNYTISKDKAAYVYKELNYQTYQDSIIKPEVNEKLKDVVSHYTALELVTSRDKVSKELRELVETMFSPMGLILQSGGGCSITNFELSPQFKESIEQKVIAEQEALRAKNELEKTKAEAEQAVEKAKGEAEAANEIAKSITVPYVAYKAIEKWNGELPTHVFLGADDIEKVVPVADATNVNSSIKQTNNNERVQ